MELMMYCSYTPPLKIKCKIKDAVGILFDTANEFWPHGSDSSVIESVFLFAVSGVSLFPLVGILASKVKGEFHGKAFDPKKLAATPGGGVFLSSLSGSIGFDGIVLQGEAAKS